MSIAPGQTYHDFVFTKYLPLNELQSTLVELIHQPTGARVMHIANDDPENLFCLSFQTLPASSNGVAHILEHTVLCGSRKFPVKDPFFAMTRRSLNTYMNALTGQDFTCYPASSQVEKDFYNLLEVYLDAVFHPELKRVSFLQEGHRLEFVDPKNPKGALQFQGVVYNEMKGAMSSIESRLWEALSKNLTPDLPYAHNSGGDPKVIPLLSYEELVEFHSFFYHPSRCLFFFYGNLPLAKHLDFIAEKALKGAPKIPLLPPLPRQPRYQAPITALSRYPIAKKESLKKKTQIVFAWLTAPISDQAELLALSLLDSILTDTDASPVKLALLKSGLCTQVESTMDVEMSEVPWAIVCKGCEEKDADALKTILFDALKAAVFSAEEMEASIHQLEFQRMEIGAEGGPFGLTLFMRAALIKQHGSEAENALLIHTLFEDLRGRLADPEYLPDLLQKYILDNPHFVQLIFRPDPKLEKEEQEEEQARLAAIRARFTEKEEEHLVQQSKELAAYQEAVENQSLDCLPKVTLRDVPPDARDFPLSETKVGDMTVYHCDCFTNQILYADLIFDLPDIPLADLSLLSLFTRLIPEIGCGGRSYAENLAYQQAYIGGFDASLSLHVTQEDPNLCRPTFSLKGKALYRNSKKLFSLFTDYAAKADFTDEERIKEWLQLHATDLQNRFVKNALSYAIQTSLSGFSLPSFVFDQWYGLPYFQLIQRLAKKFDRNLLKDLQRIQKLLLGLENPQLVLSCDREQLKQLPLVELAKELPSHSFTPWRGNYPLPKVEAHARLISAPVAFTASAFRTASYKDPASPLLLISTELLENLILHKEIREKGGAYGSGATYSPSTGNFNFYSYRDPNLSKTIDAFQKALEKIASCGFNERELEEAKLGVIQTLDAPVPPGARAMVAYSWKKAGRSWELREAYRQKILSATRQEIADAVKYFLLPHPRTLISFLGQELLEKEKSKLKHPLPIQAIE
ncbi:MAG TPA: insulinase family protein [Chlamydiales bacterium]|nr:insulinase family protein [Chlamydiales bacterium]